MAEQAVRYRGQLAVVTGASRGIGRATARALGERGCRLLLIARESAQLRHTERELHNAGYPVEAIGCDLSDKHQIRQLCESIRERYGAVGLLINCAGVGKFGPLEELALEEASDPLDVPLRAAILLSNQLMPGMLERGSGQIVNLTGPAGYFDLPFMAAYTASRAGLISFTRSLDEEVSGRGVRVKSVCPAWVDTEYLERNGTDRGWLPKVAEFYPTASEADAAGYVIQAIEGRTRELKPSLLLRLCALSYRWFPRLSIASFKLAGLYQPAMLDTAARNREGGEDWTNWEESIALKPAKTAFATSVTDVCEIVRDTEGFPSPVRAAGSRHSTTHCGVTDGGTLLIMRKMDRIVDISRDQMTVTVEAGALYIDVAKALLEQGLQFYVNVEIGNLTMGSAACTGTKDASMPGEMGQVCSYCTGVKMVDARGEVQVIDEEQPGLLQQVRSSYGLFGVIVETTFQVRALSSMTVHHRSYTLDAFEAALPELRERSESMMYYLYPFQNRLTVEFRRYLESAPARPASWLWSLRNLFWKTIAPAWGYLMTRFVSSHKVRYALIDGFYALIRVVLGRVLASERTVATDQIIRYPERKGWTKYTFSIWAFPEQEIMSTMRTYYEFCQTYYERTGFRCDMLNVGYRILADQNPLFSYSWFVTVITLDPVATGGPGWDDFLRAYNVFCSAHNGVPLFNQSKWLTREQVDKAFGGRIATFETTRSRIDPDKRFLNRYFQELFSEPI